MSRLPVVRSDERLLVDRRFPTPDRPSVGTLSDLCGRQAFQPNGSGYGSRRGGHGTSTEVLASYAA